MEGVMMKNKDRYAIAVRKPDKEIEVDIRDCKSSEFVKKIKKIPFVRGIFNFIDSLVIGMKALSFSSEFFEDEEDGEEKTETWVEKTFKDKAEGVVMAFTVVIAVILALVLFCGLPFLLAELMRTHITDNYFIIATAEGVVRIVIFVVYVALISLMEEIKRVFMYHGAEHKCINCIENGLVLNVENVAKSSKQHKRCGTSFLLIVMVISIIFLMFINVEDRVLRLVLRLVVIPVIAGVSYEFIRLAGNTDNKLVNVLSKPGLWLQKLTTKEPTDDMIEVAIASVEAVFDWKEYLAENFDINAEEVDSNVNNSEDNVNDKKKTKTVSEDATKTEV